VARHGGYAARTAFEEIGENSMKTPTDTIHHDEMASPVGRLQLVADADGLRGIWFEHERDPLVIPPHWIRVTAAHASAPITMARAQLTEYFAGKRRRFDLPLHPIGTPFQLEVWEELARIPYGVTISYADLATRIGRPRAMRAVGAANGRNPLPIIVPCHRVIGRDGSLTGFSGGVEIKRLLLDHERAAPAGDLFA
jgi:methylated-DNA-[protein]-cysteine S-methyltransferase